MAFLLNTSAIALGSAMPLKSGILDYLYYDELQNMRNILAGITNDNNLGSSTPFCVQGMTSSVVGSTYTITSGSLIYQARMYNSEPASVTLAPGQVIVGTLTTTNPFLATNADPVTFSDGSSHYVLDMVSVVWSAGISGINGDFDYDDLIFLQNPTRQVGTISTAQWDNGSGATTFNYYKVPFNKLVIDTTLEKLSSGTDPIISLPSGYRPAQDRYFRSFGGAVNKSTVLTFKIDTAGSITLWNTNGTLGLASGDIYPIYAEIPLY